MLVKLGVVQDLSSDTSTVNGRVRVKRPDENLHLRVYSLLFFGRLAANGESPDTLAVKSLLIMSKAQARSYSARMYHVLGKALGETEVMALRLEMPNRESILVGVAAGKTLIGHVKEWIMLLLFDNVADLPPLLF